MIQIAPQMRILVAVEAVDFRRGIDGLARVCRERLASDPCLRVFRTICTEEGAAICLAWSFAWAWFSASTQSRRWPAPLQTHHISAHHGVDYRQAVWVKAG